MGNDEARILRLTLARGLVSPGQLGQAARAGLAGATAEWGPRLDQLLASGALDRASASGLAEETRAAAAPTGGTGRLAPTGRPAGHASAERFVPEARVNHPNVCTVCEAGEAEGATASAAAPASS